MTGSDRLPRGIICDPGFKLMGTPLGFSGARHPGLLFFGNLDEPIPPSSQRVIGATPLIHMMQYRRRNMDALPVDYNRTFRLGRMDLRMLPAGMGKGSAMLEIKYRNRTILYCSGVRSENASDTTVPSCDLLLLDTEVAEPGAPSSVKLQQQFKEWLAALPATGRAHGIICANNSAALDMISALSDFHGPVAAHRGLYDMFRDMDMLDTPPRGIIRLQANWPTSGLVIVPERVSTSLSALSDDRVQIAHAGPGRSTTDRSRPHFRFGEREDLKGLLQFARATRASTVAFGPRCEKNTALAFKRAGFAIHFMESPVQLPLHI